MTNLEQAAGAAPTLPAAVIELLNHIEDVVSDEDWQRINANKWNAVTTALASHGTDSGAKPAGLYVASRASIPERPSMWCELRDSKGWPIISTWIDEAGPGETDNMGDLWVRIAREVASARGLILYAEPGDFPLKGAHTEVGMALALAKRVGVCMPGVDLDEAWRPLGSWAAHPLVCICPTIVSAREWVESQLTTALAHARAGLEWYRDMHPEHTDASDDEADEMFDKAAEAASAWLAGRPVPEAAISSYTLPITNGRFSKQLKVERSLRTDGSYSWAVRSEDGDCLTQQGAWEWEPQPSSRDEAFLARCRFATDTLALAAARAAIQAIHEGAPT